MTIATKGGWWYHRGDNKYCHGHKIHHFMMKSSSPADSREDQKPSQREEKTKQILFGTGRIILGCALLAGVGVAALVAPNIFVAFNKLSRHVGSLRTKDAYTPKEKRVIRSRFDYLRRRGYIHIRRDGKQIHISLTREGKKKAGKFQINELRIESKKTWDKKWRILLFDVPQSIRVSREALRGKLKELGFVLFQKSVWVHAYPCEKEVELLRDFFGLARDQITLITTDRLGAHEAELKKLFHIS